MQNKKGYLGSLIGAIIAIMIAIIIIPMLLENLENAQVPVGGNESKVAISNVTAFLFDVEDTTAYFSEGAINIAKIFLYGTLGFLILVTLFQIIDRFWKSSEDTKEGDTLMETITKQRRRDKKPKSQTTLKIYKPTNLDTSKFEGGTKYDN